MALHACSWFSNHLSVEERGGLFTFLYCGYLCCMSLPLGTVGRLQTVVVGLPSLN